MTEGFKLLGVKFTHFSEDGSVYPENWKELIGYVDTYEEAREVAMQYMEANPGLLEESDAVPSR